MKLVQRVTDDTERYVRKLLISDIAIAPIKKPNKQPFFRGQLHLGFWTEGLSVGFREDSEMTPGGD
jgi:hypothetical protein